MCLAIPAEVVKKLDDNMVEVNVLGVSRTASIDLTPQVQIGDYVLIHAGFAIEVVDPVFARETIDLVMEFPGLFECELPTPPNGQEPPAAELCYSASAEESGDSAPAEA